MSKYEVDFCDRPTWWPFINAFRYAISRPSALCNIEDWLLANISIIDHKATYLNQMIQDASYAVELDLHELRKNSIVLIPADIYHKIDFIKKVIKLAKENNITLNTHTKTCLSIAKAVAKDMDVPWGEEEANKK